MLSIGKLPCNLGISLCNPKMADDWYYTIYKQFEADFSSLNTGKTVTVCASRTGSRISRIIAPFFLLWGILLHCTFSWNLNTFSEVCCQRAVQTAIHACPYKMQRPRIFLLNFNGTLHPLGYHSCISEFTFVPQWDYSGLDKHVQCRTPVTVYAVQYSESAYWLLSTHRVCILWNPSLFWWSWKNYCCNHSCIATL